VDYPLVIAGKPFFSWQAFVPVTFEVTVLFGAAAAVLTMLHMNRLPRFRHPVFSSTRFERASDDKFFISIDSADPKYDREKTSAFLRGLGAAEVEHVRD
jgi:hypothetical protein